MRENAKDQISRVQQENQRSFNRHRQPARSYAVGDIVAIKRTQFGAGLKLKRKFLGPYKITKIKPNDTYDVCREGYHEGPKQTSTCAEYMKPWQLDNPTSEADEPQDGRLWDDKNFKGFPREKVEGGHMNKWRWLLERGKEGEGSSS